MGRNQTEDDGASIIEVQRGDEGEVQVVAKTDSNVRTSSTEGSAVVTTVTKKEKMEQKKKAFETIMMDLTSTENSSENNQDSFQLLWTAIAIVSSIFLSMLISPNGSYELTVANDNVWKRLEAERAAMDAYHFILGIGMILCFFSVLWCLGLLIQFAHIPKGKARVLMVEMGAWAVRAPTGPLMIGIALIITAALALQFSLVFSSRWVSITLIVCQGLMLAIYLCGFRMLSKKRRIVLERIESAKLEKEKLDSKKLEQPKSESWLSILGF